MNKRELRVKPMAPPPQKKKVSFVLPEPTLLLMERYLQAYAEIYGKRPDRDFVANEIIVGFIESDKAFSEHEKARRQPQLTAAEA